MPELSAPLRLTWELPASSDLAALLWRRIVAGRVLFVEVRVEAGRHAGLAGLAEGVLGLGTPRVTLLAEAAATGAALELLSAAAAEKIDLTVLPPYAPEAAPAGAWRSITWGLWSTAAGLEQFSAALRAASRVVETGVAVLNPPAPAEPLTGLQRQAVVATWRREGGAGMKLRVHDLFLARDLGLEPFREYAGCQAGEGLAHLRADGVVTACRTLPVVLGDLRVQDLRGIWSGEACRALCGTLAEAPAECLSCLVAERCRGGCRGLLPGAGAVGLTCRDPSCPGTLR